MNLKKLIIIGAGQFGREVFAWAKQSPENDTLWSIKGFLDSRPHILSGFSYDTEIIASPLEYIPEDGDLFICSLGTPSEKKAYVQPILEKGGTFTNLIHPSAILGDNVSLGTGVILCPYTIVTCDVTIGDFVSVNIHSNIGHDTRIGSWSQISPSVTINGNVTVGESVFIGSGATIVPNTTVGEGSYICAGSLAMGRIPQNVTVFGSPAKKLPVPPLKKNH